MSHYIIIRVKQKYPISLIISPTYTHLESRGGGESLQIHNYKPTFKYIFSLNSYLSSSNNLKPTIQLQVVPTMSDYRHLTKVNAKPLWRKPPLSQVSNLLSDKSLTIKNLQNMQGSMAAWVRAGRNKRWQNYQTV